MVEIETKDSVSVNELGSGRYITIDGIEPNEEVLIHANKLFEFVIISTKFESGRVMGIRITRKQALAMHEMTGEMLNWLGGEKDV